MAESIVERMRRQAFASTKRDVHYEEEQLTTETTVCPGRKNTALRNVATAGTCLSAPTCSSTTNNIILRRIEGHYGAISPDDYRITGTP